MYCTEQVTINYSELCSGSEEGSYLRLIDFVYHSTLGLRVIKKKKNSALVPCMQMDGPARNATRWCFFFFFIDLQPLKK